MILSGKFLEIIPPLPSPLWCVFEGGGGGGYCLIAYSYFLYLPPTPIFTILELSKLRYFGEAIVDLVAKHIEIQDSKIQNARQ